MFGHTKSEEYGTKVVKENDPKERVFFVAFVVLSSSFNSSLRLGIDILFVLNVTLAKLEEAAKYLKKEEKRLIMKGKHIFS